MAKKQKTRPEIVRYPWNRWFSRRKLTLTKGVDFSVEPYSMSQQIRNAAYLRGVAVSVLIKGKVLNVTIHKGK